MPARFFQAAFARLESSHQVAYLNVEADPTFVPVSPSERRLLEYQGSPAQLLGSLSGVEVLAVHGAPVTEEVLDAGADLRLVCCARGGPVNVDADALTARGLPLVNTPGKNAEAVADLTVAFIVMLARRLPSAQDFLAHGNQLRDNWEGRRFFGSDLRELTLGLVGYGQIGQRVARRVKAFGMRVLAYDPYIDAVDVEQVARLEDLLSRADVVSLHARASVENEHLIDEHALAAMRPGALLINTARETLVDERALDLALASGHLGGAALDVFQPGSPGRPPHLLRHENVVLTPHLAGATYETLRQGADMIAAEIERFAAGQPLVNVLGAVAPTT
jgi:D-3-phosphoglycerate dehydrogenase / 2-oxoglutarate reductase